jgi:hypothetical protein
MKGLLTLILLTGCRPSPPPPAEAAAPAPAPEDPLTQTVWVRADQPDLPGGMRIFLPNGTLVMDSCWETYRLVSWEKTGDRSVQWSEDGMEIQAEVASLSPQELVLRLKLTDGPQEERYRAATVPFTCPDMPR